ncbi:MAG TPA: hypothetical protein VI455_12770 [Terriglobia bacterium]
MEGRERELQATAYERRDARPRVVSGLVLVVGVAVGGVARPGLARARRAPKTSLTFTVRVYNHVRLAPAVLSSAEQETDSIFRSAGLEIVWIDCPVSGELEDAYPGCQAGLGPADFMMKILSPEMAAQASSSQTRLAYAIGDCLPDLLGCWAAASYGKVQNLALRADISPALILGKVMAHELAHLLLGPEHSDTGIMRAELENGDFGPGRLPSLVFLVAQRERLRAAVMAVRATASTAR